MSTQSCILVADSSPLYRRGMMMMLEKAGISAEVIEVESFTELKMLCGLVDNVRLLVLDAGLEGLSELKNISSIRSLLDAPCLLTVDLAADNFVRSAFLAGVHGVVRKSVDLDVMQQALLAVTSGGYWHPARETRQWVLDDDRSELMDAIPRLSRQELAVLELLKDGAMNKNIAQAMEISENTVKSHISRIFRKLKVENRTRLVLAIQSLQPEVNELKTLWLGGQNTGGCSAVSAEQNQLKFGGGL